MDVMNERDLLSKAMVGDLISGDLILIGKSPLVFIGDSNLCQWWERVWVVGNKI